MLPLWQYYASQVRFLDTCYVPDWAPRVALKLARPHMHFDLHRRPELFCGLRTGAVKTRHARAFRLDEKCALLICSSSR
jgi:hypothetical protein